MYVIFSYTLLVGYLFILSLSIYTLVHIIEYHKKFGIKLIVLLNFLTLFNALLYSTLFICSTTLFFSENINLFFWKLSLISGFINLILTSVIYVFLKEFKKIPYVPFLYFIVLLGFLIGSLFSPDSIQIHVDFLYSPSFFIPDISEINFAFHKLTGLLTIIFQCSVLLYYVFLFIIIFKKARNRDLIKNLIINTIVFIIPILMYILYIIFQIPIFREFHILSLWVAIFGACRLLIKQPDMFLELTNKIYYINIYHKSGILLYSYKFGKLRDETDAAIWGNILIGLNHILSEFVDPNDQIDVLQTNNSDIVVNYDEIGFAVVLITNHKNAILKKLMEKLTLDFKAKYKNELTEIQDLNKIINVSEFRETKEIIEKHFSLYIHSQE